MWTRQQENLARQESILDYQFKLGFKQGFAMSFRQAIIGQKEWHTEGAKHLLRNGHSVKFVAFTVDLPIDEVRSLQKGIEQGNIRIAQRMFRRGDSSEEVAEIVDLPIKQLSALQKEVYDET